MKFFIKKYRVHFVCGKKILLTKDQMETLSKSMFDLTNLKFQSYTYDNDKLPFLLINVNNISYIEERIVLNISL